MQTIFVISSYTNGGKDTVIGRLLGMDLGLARIITATSRAMRPGEKEGNPYHFFTPEEFERKIKAGEFLEWARVHNDYKGNLKSSFAAMPKDRNVIIQLDVQGYARYKELFAGSEDFRIVGIFIDVPSFDELKRRMIARGGDLSDMKKRLDDAAEEQTHIGEYDFVVMNDDLERCVADTAEIIRKYR
jgi:guanylate kinase